MSEHVVCGMGGALVIYDALTLQEVKRLPMKKPVGKYNVWNKISKSEGTSHLARSTAENAQKSGVTAAGRFLPRWNGG